MAEQTTAEQTTTETRYPMPLIGDKAPAFDAVTTQGPVSFPADYAGKWVILFSHPADFTPVCTTEFMTFATMEQEFRDLNTELVGLSVDSLYAHIAWLRKIQDLEWNGMKDVEVRFPLIEDIRMDVAKKYGMIQPGQSSTQAVRAVFIIDPEGVIRTILYYPLSTGRNFDEIKRIVIALQKADSDAVATPADWRPGDDVIVPTAGSCGVAKERMTAPSENEYYLDWFMGFRKESEPARVARPRASAPEPAERPWTPRGVRRFPRCSRGRPGRRRWRAGAPASGAPAVVVRAARAWFRLSPSCRRKKLPRALPHRSPGVHRHDDAPSSACSQRSERSAPAIRCACNPCAPRRKAPSCRGRNLTLSASRRPANLESPRPTRTRHRQRQPPGAAPPPPQRTDT